MKTPVVEIKTRDLQLLLGKKLEAKDIYWLFTKLKCEIESIDDDSIIYEANSDRPDLFSVEGVSRALKPWLGLSWRKYSIVESGIKGYAKNIPERPYVALAAVKDLQLSDEAVSQIMQLQEKITQTYGRGRRKVSIGVYDLDLIKPPITYDLADPNATVIRPLNESKQMNLKEILDKTEKGILYGYIIRNMPKYPVLRDSEGRILSLVPIINSDDCKVTPATKNILIDATGTSLDDVINAVTIMATSIAERSTTGVIENVKVEYENGLIVEAPRRESVEIKVDLSDVNNLLGTNFTLEQVADFLKYFYYEIIEATNNSLVVKPPVYRIDVKSWVDVAEDIAIAYGYEALGSDALYLPPTNKPGKIHPLEYLSRRLRDILTGLGFQEIANYMMSSKSIQQDLLGIRQEMFLVENPRSERFEGLRIWLTPQLIEVVRENTDKYARIMLFEIGDVVVPDSEQETKARVERRLGIVLSHDKATLTDGLAYVKALLRELNVDVAYEKSIIPGFLPERTALIRGCDGELGFVGEIDPKILYKLEIKNPVVVAELYLNKIINLCIQ
ncbi:MAG: phenylalanine--tRNA ligase subunit beta [Desulfurococcaceae archaeon]